MRYWERVCERFAYRYDEVIREAIWARHFSVNIMCLLCGELQKTTNNRGYRKKGPVRCDICGSFIE